MTIIIEPSWLTIPVLAALILGTLSLVITVLLAIWAAIHAVFERRPRDRDLRQVYGPQLWGGGVCERKR